MEDLALIRSMDLFRDLTEDEAALVAKAARPVAYAKGAVIIRERESDGTLYILKSGSVRVSKVDHDGLEEVMTYFNAGQHFGEVALIDHKPRSATVIAEAPCEMLQIGPADFAALLASSRDLELKIWKSLAKFFCHRLRDTTDYLCLALNDEA